MQTAKFIIDGHEVSATFAPQENQEVVQRVKQILLSAFASKKIFTEGICTFAIPGEREDNMDGSAFDAP